MNKFTKPLLTTGTFLIFGMMFANGANFLFNAYLGRELSFEGFGLITLINTFWYLINVFLAALSTTVNHRIAYLNAKNGKHAGLDFYKRTLKHSFRIGVVVSIMWLLSVNFIAHFFNTSSLLPFFFFTPIILFGFIYATNKGYISGNLLFHVVGLTYIIESVVKLVVAVALVKFGWDDSIYISIPISVLTSLIVVAIIIYVRNRKIQTEAIKHNYRFPRRFYAATIVASLASQMFLTTDVLFTKHFLSQQYAGEYAFLSLVGKMIFFFGSLFNTFLTPLISREEGLGKNPNMLFYKLFAINIVLTALMFVAIGPLGWMSIPLLYGYKAYAIIPYLTPYALAIALFTLANTVVSYHLLRHHFSFSIAAILISGMMMIGIVFHHQNIQAIVDVVLFTSTTQFILMMGMHFLQRNSDFFVRNLVDFICVFLPLPKVVPKDPNGKRILIFNWRDTKHMFAGGAEVYIHELAKRWVKAGNKVTLFCGNDSNNNRYEMIDGIEIIRRGGFYFVYFWAFIYYILRFRNQYDIVIDSENGIPFFTPLYASGQKYLLIHHVHQEVFRRSLKPPFSWFASFLEKRFMPYVYKNCEVITVSPSSKREIIKHNLTTKDPVIIYNGIDTTVYKPAEKSIKPTVLYLGRLKQYKQVHVFIEAAKKVLAVLPDTEFVIAGDGEEKKELIKLTRKLKLSEKITFLGKVNEEQKLKAYQQAWVFVNPSMMEGWGITTIEANACGTPIVASDVPGLRDSVRDNKTGYLVPPSDTEAFATKIIELLTNHNLRKQMAQEAIAWAQEYDWNISADTSLKLIHESRPTSYSQRRNYSL